MEENSSTENLELINDSSIARDKLIPSSVQRKLYFINEVVEWQLTQYIWTGCTQVRLRDMIMSHATELIRQIIRKQNLHAIYPGQDDSSFYDLLQTAWVQIERTLYKYRSRPHCRNCFNPDRPMDSLLYDPAPVEYGIKTLKEVVSMHPKCPTCGIRLQSGPMVDPVQGLYAGSETVLYKGMSKVFNMWSQVARTVILAHIKKEGRDRKNSGSYMTHLGNKHKPISGIMERMLQEMRDMNQYDENHLKIINSLEHLITTDDKPHDGLIGKLVAHSGLSRQIVTNFLRVIKLRSFEMTDSLVNRTIEPKSDGRKGNNSESDEE